MSQRYEAIYICNLFATQLSYPIVFFILFTVWCSTESIVQVDYVFQMAHLSTNKLQITATSTSEYTTKMRMEVCGVTQRKLSARNEAINTKPAELDLFNSHFILVQFVEWTLPHCLFALFAAPDNRISLSTAHFIFVHCVTISVLFWFLFQLHLPTYKFMRCL